MANKRKFGELVTAYRERKDFTKTELGKRLGVSLTSIIRYEDPDEKKKPSIKNISRLCSVLELSETEEKELFDAAMLSDEDIQQIHLMLKSLVSPMFDEEIVDIITRQELIEAYGLLSKMDNKTLDQALKSMLAVVKGFS